MPSCRYIAGGPIPFPMGSICPMCNGDGKRPVVSTENISLMVIWNSTEFMNQTTVADDSQDRIQTITFKENTPKLVRAESLIVATGISAYTQHRYQRMGSPRPCGFGDTDFVECVWKRL